MSTKNPKEGTVVEVQRNGQWRVRLEEDERISVSDIPTHALAVEIDRAMTDCFLLGTKTYRAQNRWLDDEFDD